MKLYVRMNGVNRFAGGTDKWLKVRHIQKKLFDIVLEVNVSGQKRFLNFSNNRSPANIEFRIGEWPDTKPCSWDTVIQHMTKNWIETE